MKFPKFIQDILTSGKLPISSTVQVSVHSSVVLDEAKDLYQSVKDLSPINTMEIGLAYGLSALTFTQALNDFKSKGKHHAIDPFQEEFNTVGLKTVQFHGLSEYFVFHGQFPEKCQDSLPEVGLAFIDGSHLFDYTILDFMVCDRKLVSGGVIAFHDCSMKSVQKAIRYVLTNRSYEMWAPSNLINWNPPLTLAMFFKTVIGKTLRLIPGANNIFSPELLKPWHEIGRRNLLFLRKKSQDQRDWRFHTKF